MIIDFGKLKEEISYQWSAETNEYVQIKSYVRPKQEYMEGEKYKQLMGESNFMTNVRTNKSHTRKEGVHDNCQTPQYAVDPLVKWIPKDIKTIWEPASGEGNVSLVLERSGFRVISSDIKKGVDFYDYANRPFNIDMIITNPPYSQKKAWMERCLVHALPFALLLPVNFIGTKGAQDLFKSYKWTPQVIYLDKRINFKMPNKGYSGGGSHFATAWFTYKFDLPRDNIFEEVKVYEDIKKEYPDFIQGDNRKYKRVEER